MLSSISCLAFSVALLSLFSLAWPAQAQTPCPGSPLRSSSRPQKNEITNAILILETSGTKPAPQASNRVERIASWLWRGAMTPQWDLLRIASDIQDRSRWT